MAVFGCVEYLSLLASDHCNDYTEGQRRNRSKKWQNYWLKIPGDSLCWRPTRTPLCCEIWN
ncbi:hypothetical protein TorRG33x02_106880 [Trema orientale]|uniref:Uncharacterized protein n=1 Tax=Trema orientale TaxID=63057 RepID=A0A2P5F6K2_TREOI|nr:hypothetical protein TorRG33x02_106880 [Trema orientale]